MNNVALKQIDVNTDQNRKLVPSTVKPILKPSHATIRRVSCFKNEHPLIQETLLRSLEVNPYRISQTDQLAMLYYHILISLHELLNYLIS